MMDTGLFGIQERPLEMDTQDPGDSSGNGLPDYLDGLFRKPEIAAR